MTPLNVEAALSYGIVNAPVRSFPFPHIYVPDVFPDDFYADLQRHLPDPAAMVPIEQARSVKGYKERFVLDVAGPMDGLTEPQRAFWRQLSGWLLAGRFRTLLLNRFAPFLRARFPSLEGLQFWDETLLVEDITHYALGPHTDAPSKVITLLFYLPADDSQAHLGTSIYMPKDPARRCPGGPHYRHDDFDRVATMPFRPNTLFAFVKTDNSFHGVEPVLDPETRRWLLLYDVRVRAAEPRPPFPSPGTGG